MRRKQQETGRCGRAEVRDPETDEKREGERERKQKEESEQGRRQRRSQVRGSS